MWQSNAIQLSLLALGQSSLEQKFSSQDSFRGQMSSQNPSTKINGRENELERLEEIYRDFCQGKMSSVDKNEASCEGKLGDSSDTPMVSISGYSGSGNSTLMKQFESQ